jgi:hypothetical protein
VEPLMSITDFEEFAGRTFTGARRTQIERFLRGASSLVRTAARPDLDGVDHTNAPDSIQTIVFTMVSRGLGNPRMLHSERIGDYNQQANGQGIYLTPEEERQINDALERSIIGHVTLQGEMPERLLLEADLAFPVDFRDH